MKRLLFFINPNAGHAEIRGTLMEVLEIFSAGGYEVTVHMTTRPARSDAPDRRARRAVRSDRLHRRRRDAQRGGLRSHGPAV